MKEDRFNYILKKTEAWRFGEDKRKICFGGLQDFAALIGHLKKNYISVEEFVEYIEKRKNQIKKYFDSQPKITKEQRIKLDALVQRCPNCGSTLSIPQEVKRKNKNGWRSVIRCSSCSGCKKSDKQDESDPNKHCTYERFSTETVEEILKKYNDEVNKILGV